MKYIRHFPNKEICVFQLISRELHLKMCNIIHRSIIKLPYGQVWFYLRARGNEIWNYFFKRSKARKLITKLKFLNSYQSNPITKPTWVFPRHPNDLDGEQLIFCMSALDIGTLTPSLPLPPHYISHTDFQKACASLWWEKSFKTEISWTTFASVQWNCPGSCADTCLVSKTNR